MRKTITLPVLAFLFICIPGLVFSQIIGNQVDPLDYDLDVSADQTRLDVLQKRYVKLNEWDMGYQLDLSLFPDFELSVYLEDLEVTEERKTWKGHIPGTEGAYAIITEQDGIFFGKIIGPDWRSFQIVHKGESIYAIYEIDPSNLALDENDGLLDEEQGDVVQADETICDQAYVCSATNIDMLIVYTPAAKAELGGQASTEAAIASAVAEMNTVNSNSNVPHTYTLVHTAEVTFTESGNSSTDLGDLRSTTDGVMDIVHQLRYAHRADLVALITSSSYCGRGYVPSNNTYFSATSGFNISGVNCMTGNLTLAHESGHNMGLHHDYHVNSSTSPCSHNHGYVNQAANGGTSAQRWRTVMAYNDQCSDVWGFSCRRRPYWSNPDVNFGGDPMGVSIGNAQPSNSAFALNRSSCLVAGMSDQLVSFPVVYDSWNAKSNKQNIELSWATAQELNNTGFEIEVRSDTSKNFQQAGFVAGKGNSTERHVYSFRIKQAFPGVHYIRLKQIDQDGSFSYSSIQEVEIKQGSQIYHRVFPNPSDGFTKLEFSVYSTSAYTINVMDINGQITKQVFAGELATGSHLFEVDLSDMSPGLYFYSIRSLVDQEMGKLWIK